MFVCICIVWVTLPTGLCLELAVPFTSLCPELHYGHDCCEADRQTLTTKTTVLMRTVAPWTCKNTLILLCSCSARVKVLKSFSGSLELVATEDTLAFCVWCSGCSLVWEYSLKCKLVYVWFAMYIQNFLSANPKEIQVTVHGQETVFFLCFLHHPSYNTIALWFLPHWMNTYFTVLKYNWHFSFFNLYC